MLVPRRGHPLGPAGRRPGAALREAIQATPSDATTVVIAADHAIDDLHQFVGRAVTLLPRQSGQQLEYDHVIVVEPAEIVAAEPRGYSRLYVVLTRAVDTVTVLHRTLFYHPPR